MKGNLSTITVMELSKLFKAKSWEINEIEDVKISLFQRYCDRLKHLNDREQKLFIELSYKFEQIGFSDYLECFLMSFHNLRDDILKNKEKIIFSPLTKPYLKNLNGKDKIERPKTKSSQFLYYLLASNDLRWIDYSQKFEFCETLTDIKNNFIEQKTLLLLVDDFVGTGDTAIRCCKTIINEIQADKIINNEDVYVVSIAALKSGIKKIKDELNISTFRNFIRQKGITDNYSSKDAEEKIIVMLGIERKLYCPKDCSLGFGKSEALISFMNKTPNNTFPAFWHETKTTIAPFPRYKNFK
jgi:hypothetical protein